MDRPILLWTSLTQSMGRCQATVQEGDRVLEIGTYAVAQVLSAPTVSEGN